MKSILFFLSFTCLVVAADHRELVQQLNNYKAQLLRHEKVEHSSRTIAEIEAIKNEIFLLKHQMRQAHKAQPATKLLNVTTESSDFELLSVYIYNWTDSSDRIVAHIRNISDIYPEWVKVYFHFYKNNVLIGDEFSYIDFETYGNTGVLPFHTSFLETYVDKMDYDEVKVLFEYDVDPLGNDVALCEELLQLLDVSVTGESPAEWQGMVNNGANYSVEFPKIFADFYQGTEFIDMDYTYLDTECQGNRTIIIDYVIDSPLEAQEITLHNCTEQDINLGGWYLGNKGNPYSYVIPAGTTIDADGYVTFDNDDLNFAISQEDEIIYLSNPLKTQIDTWTKDEIEYVLEPFTSCAFDSYLNLPASFETVNYPLLYSLHSAVPATLRQTGHVSPCASMRSRRKQRIISNSICWIPMMTRLNFK